MSYPFYLRDCKNLYNVHIHEGITYRRSLSTCFSFETAIEFSKVFFFLLWRCDPTRVMASSFLRFQDLTQRRIKVGRTPLDEWSARRRDLYLTTHNTRNRQTSMPPVGFETRISVGERPQTYALDRAATGTSFRKFYWTFIGLYWDMSVENLHHPCPIWCLVNVAQSKTGYSELTEV
jgi:hypothetical protein